MFGSKAYMTPDVRHDEQYRGTMGGEVMGIHYNAGMYVYPMTHEFVRSYYTRLQRAGMATILLHQEKEGEGYYSMYNLYEEEYYTQYTKSRSRSGDYPYTRRRRRRSGVGRAFAAQSVASSASGSLCPAQPLSSGHPPTEDFCLLHKRTCPDNLTCL